jgi:methionyl-tRNA formyltransferase
VINGEKETGVTTFKLKHEIDTGNILLQERFPIGENETAGEVHDKMKEIGAQLLVKTVEGLANGSLKEMPQSEMPGGTSIKHAPKIFSETCRIDWNKTADEVHNLVRGLSPFPGAFTILGNKILKIFSAEKQIGPTGVSIGEYETDGKSCLRFAAADGYLDLREIQLEGKKRMKVEDFLRGHKF